MICRKCGKCCKIFELELKDNANTASARTAILANFAAYGMKFSDVDKIKFKINGKCKYLSDENLCMIYSGERPQRCKDFLCGKPSAEDN